MKSLRQSAFQVNAESLAVHLAVHRVVSGAVDGAVNRAVHGVVYRAVPETVDLAIHSGRAVDDAVREKVPK